MLCHDKNFNTIPEPTSDWSETDMNARSATAVFAELNSFAVNAADANPRIRQTGARPTMPRTAVLTALITAERALTHQEIVQCLAPRMPMDRVTIYRVLTLLIDQGLAHRLAPGDRVWRCSISRDDAGNPCSHHHGHSACRDCGKTVCLEDIPEDFPIKLPHGFWTEEVELTLHGLCNRSK